MLEFKDPRTDLSPGFKIQRIITPAHVVSNLDLDSTMVDYNAAE